MGSHLISIYVMIAMDLMAISSENTNITKDDNIPEYKSFPLSIAGDNIVTYLSPFIVIIGIIGNVLSIMVMTLPSNSQSSFCIYLIALSIADIGSLLSWGYRWYLIVSESMVTALECKLDIGAKYSFRIIGYWLVVLLTLDRFIAVKFPMKAMTYCNTRKATVVSIVLFILGFIYALPYLYYGTSNADSKCFMVSAAGNFTIIYMFSVIIFGLLIPIFVISSLNVMIYQGIKSRVKYNPPVSSEISTVSANVDIEPNSSKDDNASKAMPSNRRKPLTKQDRSLVTILLVVTVTFIILNSPQVIRSSMNYIMGIMHVSKSNIIKSRDHFAWAFTNTLGTINYAINFFLYCLSSRKFRVELMGRIAC